MAIAVLYNPADIDATVTAAMLHKICEYHVTTNIHDVKGYDKIISLGNDIPKDYATSSVWIVVNKMTSHHVKETAKGFIKSFFGGITNMKPEQTIIPEVVDGEVVKYGSYLRHYYNILDLDDWMTPEELLKYEHLCHDMSTCVRMLDLRDQSILWSIQKNAREILANKTTDIRISVRDSEYDGFQKFLRDIKREISEKICTETVLINRKAFDKSINKLTVVQTVNAELWKSPWIFKITSHITPAICVFEYVRHNHVHMRTKYFNDDGEAAINNILSERNLRWSP